VAVYLVVCEMHRDLENYVSARSKSLKMALFYNYTTFCWSATVSIVPFSSYLAMRITIRSAPCMSQVNDVCSCFNLPDGTILQTIFVPKRYRLGVQLCTVGGVGI